MARALHSEWRCPACGERRITPTPVVEAFCVAATCPDLYVPMIPWLPRREHVSDVRFTTPELTPEQQSVDYIMRTNRGLSDRPLRRRATLQ